jgi:hypothetical protein
VNRWQELRWSLLHPWVATWRYRHPVQWWHAAQYNRKYGFRSVTTADRERMQALLAAWQA